MKVVYTLLNVENNIAYVGQTNSFSRRLSEHIRAEMLQALGFESGNYFTLIMQNKLKITTILVGEQYRKIEKETIANMRQQGYTLLNKYM